MDKEIRYRVPCPILDQEERESLDAIQKRWEKLCRPGPLKKAGKAISEAVPAPVKGFSQAVRGKLSGQKLFDQTMRLLNEGFKLLEETASRYTIPRGDIIRRVNLVTKDNEIGKIEEICLARGYDLSRLVRQFRRKDMLFTLGESVGTGAIGLWGLPFVLAVSGFVNYRAVQTVAAFYGYDVREDPSELIIAGEVLMNAMSPSVANADEISSAIARFMAFAEAETVKQATKKSAEIISRNGAGLLAEQIRALANRAAQRALEKAGEKGLEKAAFQSVFEQIGKKVSKEAVGRAVPVVSAVIGGLFDLSQMNAVLSYADVFYNKRFLVEKEERVRRLLNPDGAGPAAKAEEESTPGE